MQILISLTTLEMLGMLIPFFAIPKQLANQHVIIKVNLLQISPGNLLVYLSKITQAICIL